MGELLDDCLHAPQAGIPLGPASLLSASRDLTASGHGGRQAQTIALQTLSHRLFYIDIAEVQTTEGKLHLFVAIDQTSKFAVTQLVEKADWKTT